jgi:hypothetical protein
MNFATKYEKQSDGSLLGGGDVKPGSVMHIWVDTKLTNITGFQVEALTHPNLPYDGPGLVGRGSFLLKEFTCEVYPTQHAGVTNKVKFRRALASREAPGFAITNAIDGNNDKGGWTPSAVPVQRNREERAVFECEEPIPGFEGGTTLQFGLYQKHSNADGHSGELDKETKLDCHALGRLRLSVTTEAAPLAVDRLSPAQRALLAVPMAQRKPEQIRELFNVFRLSDPAFAKPNAELEGVWTNWPYAVTTLALSQSAQPRPTRILKRGDRLRPLEEVQAGVPAMLHPFPKDSAYNRLGLAQWLVDAKSPTTARVLVNRIWQSYFGAGLVTTPEDFGTRVEAPSHPELLDWLACEFMHPNISAEGSAGIAPVPWSFKHIHRLIVHSATYKQASKINPQLYAIDPLNRFLGRGARFRVEGEIIQDIALSASGLLNPKIGGPSVYPPIPASVADTVYGGFTWPETKGEDRYRRALYTFWKRALPFPTLLAFDGPTAESACARRVRSNTPLQALTTLNEKTFIEASQAMGLRVLKEGGKEDRTKVEYAFRLGVGRSPTAAEVKALVDFWHEQFQYLENHSDAAIKIALADTKTIPPDINIHKAAAWAMVSRAILNLDETLTRQ